MLLKHGPSVLFVRNATAYVGWVQRSAGRCHRFASRPAYAAAHSDTSPKANFESPERDPPSGIPPRSGQAEIALCESLRALETPFKLKRR